MLHLTVTPNVLWPPDHSLRSVTVGITTTDHCDSNPRVRLLSVTSSEPDNGLGDGDMPGDIVGASIGTDDRSFQLRAERAGIGSGDPTPTTEATGSGLRIDRIFLGQSFPGELIAGTYRVHVPKPGTVPVSDHRYVSANVTVEAPV
jgi:hypothetical protein